ncbi:3-phosphoshikimate 1-carboxyvinyltransferase [Alteromonas sp. A081]|uniref:3-phosphoshikimate 1-carboxyvinyltransferase n=1 Tax=Alteromonas sp. A081 TaxID=3410269 RepID=UPI003B9861E7
MVLKIKHPVREEPNVQHLLERIPDKVANSFSDEQLAHLNTALAGRKWGNHKIDLRGTISFFRSRFYIVVLAGKDKRDLSREEARAGKIIMALGLMVFVSFSILVGLFLLYVLKSWLGINLFEGFSLGLWDWLKANT